MNAKTKEVYNKVVNATPQARIVGNTDPLYKEIEAIEGDEWVELLDTLATHGLTIKYNNNEDCFAIA